MRFINKVNYEYNVYLTNVYVICSSFDVVITLYKIAFVKVRNFYSSFLNFLSLLCLFKQRHCEDREGIEVGWYHTERDLGNAL